MPLAAADVSARFADRFGQLPRWIVRAPGRVNLIGEHTDYNDGFVLPMAIDRAVWIALRPRNDRIVSIYSVDFDQQAEFSLESVSEGSCTVGSCRVGSCRVGQAQRGPTNTSDADALNGGTALRLSHPTSSGATNGRGFVSGWIEYVKGTAWSLQDSGRRLSGWEGVLAGDVPLGAGLSSSAALEMAAARAMAAAAELPWTPAEMALLGQRAENRWVGVNCGIMDQLISAAGRAGGALLIDCRSLHVEPAPLPPGTAVVVLDTATRRGLVDSAYNQRRSQCEEAARLLNVAALRDATLDLLDHSADKLDPVVFRRARHVIAENDRSLRAADAMHRGDAVELGRLMQQSHRSLRDDYEVSSDALNAMVECASEHGACFGARMTGAGFGGCAVALVRAAEAEDFVSHTAAAYEKRTGLSPAVYVCQPAAGAEVV